MAPLQHHTLNAFCGSNRFYSKNRTKHGSTLCRQNAELLNIKLGGTYSCQCALECQKTWQGLSLMKVGPLSFACEPLWHSHEKFTEEEVTYWVDMVHCSRHTAHSLSSACSGAFGCKTKDETECDWVNRFCACVNKVHLQIPLHKMTRIIKTKHHDATLLQMFKYADLLYNYVGLTIA
jgi:hypothetical protein